MSKTISIKLLFDAKKFNDGIQKASKSLKKFKDVGQKLTIAGGAMGAALGGMVKVAGDFNKSMSNVSTLVDTNTESMKDMKKEILEMSTKMPVSISDLSASLYDIRSAGISAGDAMATLKQSAILSKAGLSSVSEATDIMTSAMNSFASEGLSAAEISDIIFKTVKAGKTTVSQLAQAFGATAPIIQSAGIKLADFQAATAALTTVGTPAAQAQNQIRAAVVSLLKPTKEMQTIFKELGTESGTALIQSAGGMGNAFKLISDKAKEMGIELVTATGRVEAAAAMTSLAGATNKTYTDTLDSMVNGSNAISEAYQKQAQEFNASMQILTNKMQSFAISIGNALIPTIQQVSQAFGGLLDWFNNLSEPTKELIAKFALFATTAALVAGPLLILIGSLPAIGAGFAAVGTAVASAITILSGVGPIILGIVAAGALIIANWKKIKETAIAVWQKGIRQSIWDLLKQIPGWLVEIGKKALEIGKALIQGIWKGIQSMDSWLKNNFEDWAKFILSEIGRQFQIKSPSKATEEIGRYLALGLSSGIEKNISYPVEAAGNLANQVISEIEAITVRIDQLKSRESAFSQKEELENIQENIKKAENELKLAEERLKIAQEKHAAKNTSSSLYAVDKAQESVRQKELQLQKEKENLRRHDEQLELKSLERKKQALEKSLAKETEKIDRELRKRLALYNYSILGELQERREAEYKKLHLLKEGTVAHEEQLIKIYEIEKRIWGEIEKVRKDAQKKQKEYSEKLKGSVDLVDQDFRKKLREIAEHIKNDFLRNLAKVVADAAARLSETITGSLTNNIEAFLNKTKTAGQALKDFFKDLKAAVNRMIAEIIAEMLKLYVIQPIIEKIFSSIFGPRKPQGGGIKGLVSSGLNFLSGGGYGGYGGIFGGLGNLFKGFFDSGGVVPGSYSQPVPVMAHGNEMILNPSQQAQLWNMANGNTGQFSSPIEPRYIYAPQISTGATPEDVFRVLDKHSKEFFARIQIGIQSNYGLRSAIKNA